MALINELVVNEAFLITGGNLGLRTEHLHLAATAIADICGPIQRASGIYETKAWGYTHQPDFYNQVLLIKTELDAFELLKNILDIEIKMGRERLIKMGPRIIDIDILFFNNEIINTEKLQVPHPRIVDRRFVLEPLYEIAPEFVHPIYNQTISTLLDVCSDELAVHKI